MGRLFPFALFALSLFLVASPADATRTFVVVGTGGVTGVYFPAGGALCRVVNEARRSHGIRCSVEATAGSVHNVDAVIAGDLDIGVAQADVQFQAVRGAGAFDGRPRSDLRVLFSLHDEAFTVVARADSGIRSFSDLAGRRVNIGNVGSGQRSAMDMLMLGMGWDINTFEAALELGSRDQAQALCDGRVEAIVFVAGHPNASIREALRGCDGVLVPVHEKLVAALTDGSAYLTPVRIDASLYGLPSKQINSFGTVATVVASKALDEDVVHAFTRSVFEGLARVIDQHPALNGLTRAGMVSEGFHAPMHKGAARYFREVGLIQE